MEEMRCARKAFAVSLDSSADHRFAHRMRSSGIQCSYTLLSTPIARCPLSVSFPADQHLQHARARMVLSQGRLQWWMAERACMQLPLPCWPACPEPPSTFPC